MENTNKLAHEIDTKAGFLDLIDNHVAAKRELMAHLPNRSMKEIIAEAKKLGLDDRNGYDHLYKRTEKLYEKFKKTDAIFFMEWRNLPYYVLDTKRIDRHNERIARIDELIVETAFIYGIMPMSPLPGIWETYLSLFVRNTCPGKIDAMLKDLRKSKSFREFYKKVYDYRFKLDGMTEGGDF